MSKLWNVQVIQLFNDRVDTTEYWVGAESRIEAKKIVKEMSWIRSDKDRTFFRIRAWGKLAHEKSRTFKEQA
jgi:hypothetical protein